MVMYGACLDFEDEVFIPAKSEHHAGTRTFFLLSGRTVQGAGFEDVHGFT